MHAFKRFLKQIKRFNYPIYKTGYSRSASRPTSVFGPPHMCVWDEIIEQYKRAGGRLEQEGEMDTLATPCHETETLSVSRYYAQYAPNASAGIEELRPNPKLLERAIETLKDCDPPRNLESVVPSPTPPPRFVEMLPPPPAVFQYSIDLGGGAYHQLPPQYGAAVVNVARDRSFSPATGGAAAAGALFGNESEMGVVIEGAIVEPTNSFTLAGVESFIHGLGEAMGVHPPEQVPTAAALAGGDCCIENISMEGAQGDPPEQAAVPIEEDPVINEHEGGI